MNRMRTGIAKIYHLLSGRKFLVRPEVRADLERLYPGRDRDELCQDYYVRKLEKSFVIFLAGSVLAILLAIKAVGERNPERGNALRRGEAADTDREVTVETVLQGERERFAIQLRPRQLTEEETLLCYEEFIGRLPELIAGKNASLREVAQDLNLQESYEEYPFSVEWRSLNVDRVTSAGAVSPGEQGEEVTLQADIAYGEWEWRQTITVWVLPKTLTEEEARYGSLAGQLLIREEETRQEEYLILPESLDGEELTWRLVVEDNSLLLWAGAVAVSVLIYIMSDRDLHVQLEQQREEMRRRYPDIVHKLALYLGAGMTLQGAFRKIGVGYERKKEDRIRPDPIYEQILYTCRELDSGVPEGSAYERFGKRTGVQEYIRLGTLMAQHLKRGSSSLLPRLHEESQKALEEQIRAGRKLGEEASSKLLIPMVMMLAVVMVMIMLPAFTGMGV